MEAFGDRECGSSSRLGERLLKQRNKVMNRHSFRLKCILLVAVFVSSSEAQEMKLVERKVIEPRIELLTLYSGALERPMRCSVILPEKAGTENAKRPMLLFLHGRGRNERSLLERKDSKTALMNAPFVIVMPQGNLSWWIDSPVRSKDRYDRYLIELIDFLADEYRLDKRSTKCAVTGWSMGGYGAMRLIQNHPDRFDTVATIIGLLDYPRPVEDFPVGQSYPVRTDELGDDPTAWPKLNPLNHTAALRSKSILLVTGTEAFDRTMNERFRDRLRKEGTACRYTTLDGSHSLDVVAASLPVVLDFVDKAFSDDLK